MTLTPLPPTARLVLYELASCHNEQTGECYPSPSFLAVKTGLSVPNVRAAVGILMDAGLIAAAEAPRGWRIVGLDDDDGDPLPPDWSPDEATIAALVAAFPNHHFDPAEAIHEFIAYARERRITCSPARRNTLFFHNVAAYLRKQRHGPVTFDSRKGRGGTPSLRSFLAKPGPLPLSFLR